MTKLIRIGISQGDINGVGYEVIMKALDDKRMLEMCTPIIYGSPKVAAYHRKAIDLETFQFNTIEQAESAVDGKVNIINCIDDNVHVELGKLADIAGEASYMALDAAVQDLKAGKIDALVTAPISKDNIQSEKFNFPGHTEFLAEQFHVDNHIMLMVSEKMRVGVVTTHVPLKDVAKHITQELIVKKLRIIASTMEQDFSIKRPRIAVLGLNPHCGDGGLIGKEEQDVIIPAIEQAKKEGILALGPYPSDGFFGSDDYTKFDVTLAMYHDQGLTPFKVLTFDHGVNYTAGLPVVRTSPCHGTGFAIAGKNVAKETSFREALFLAMDIHKNRQIHAQITVDPLKMSKAVYNNKE
ncbi:MAG: 4-hydroxythreonine-4-phosphate dehydrogenase PdxA [Mangrovibacterium sp.]